MPSPNQKVGPVGLLPLRRQPRSDSILKTVNIQPVIFIFYSLFSFMFMNSISLFFFLEQSTTISPRIIFTKDKKNAQPNPILRLRPKQPTPYASDTAITIKITFSIVLILYCILLKLCYFNFSKIYITNSATSLFSDIFAICKHVSYSVLR